MTNSNASNVKTGMDTLIDELDPTLTTLVMKPGSLTTAGTGVDQVVSTYTVTSGKNFYLQYYQIEANLSVLSALASSIGNISLESPAGTKLITNTLINATVSLTPINKIEFAQPMLIPGGTVIRVVCTPAVSTSIVWNANFGGYEK